MSPGRTSNALYHASILRTGPFTRNCGGECGSLAIRLRISSLRQVTRHACAQPRKTRCLPVKPPMIGGGRPSNEIRYASSASTKLPKIGDVLTHRQRTSYPSRSASAEGPTTELSVGWRNSGSCLRLSQQGTTSSRSSRESCHRHPLWWTIWLSLHCFVVDQTRCRG